MLSYQRVYGGFNPSFHGDRMDMFLRMYVYVYIYTIMYVRVFFNILILYILMITYSMIWNTQNCEFILRQVYIMVISGMFWNQNSYCTFIDSWLYMMGFFFVHPDAWSSFFPILIILTY
jgi:hypothetical protein